MKTAFLTALGGLSFLASTTTATSTVLVKNYCTGVIFLTIYSNGTTDGPFGLGSEQAFLTDIVGEGGTTTVSQNSNIWSAQTAKMILGSSTDNNILYWSINNVSGDPFAGQFWEVTSSGTSQNICGFTTHYGDEVYACPDNAVTLVLSLC